MKACEINLVKRILHKAFSLAVDISESALFKDVPHHYLKRADVKIHVTMRADTKTRAIELDMGYSRERDKWKKASALKTNVIKCHRSSLINNILMIESREIKVN